VSEDSSTAQPSGSNATRALGAPPAEVPGPQDRNSTVSENTHILILGGYGLIGREITAACLAAGHKVTGAGRSPETGRRLIPDADWIGIDLNEATLAAHWQPHLQGIDIVINASGALQSGGRDDLAKIQRDAIRALTIACEKAGIKTFVQISAPGATPDAATEFMATKGAADETLRASSLDWVILKPGLVIAPTAYGGTSLLRRSRPSPSPTSPARPCARRPIPLSPARRSTSSNRKPGRSAK
jgi:uncharacterized protein YbjT (DUF2867 family)